MPQSLQPAGNAAVDQAIADANHDAAKNTGLDSEAELHLFSGGRSQTLLNLPSFARIVLARDRDLGFDHAPCLPIESYKLGSDLGKQGDTVANGEKLQEVQHLRPDRGQDLGQDCKLVGPWNLGLAEDLQRLRCRQDPGGQLEIAIPLLHRAGLAGNGKRGLSVAERGRRWSHRPSPRSLSDSRMMRRSASALRLRAITWPAASTTISAARRRRASSAWRRS